LPFLPIGAEDSPIGPAARFRKRLQIKKLGVLGEKASTRDPTHWLKVIYADSRQNGKVELGASAQTDLAARFTTHVVSAWPGKTLAVTTKHYLCATREDFERAAKEP